MVVKWRHHASVLFVWERGWSFAISSAYFNILCRMIKPSQLPSFSETQAEAETKRKNEHYDWFILLLVLPTVSIWLKS